MEMLAQDLRFAVRGILKRPGFSLIVVTTLALGIGANTAIFSVVNAVLLSSLPYPAASQLVVVTVKNERQNLTQQPISYPNVRDLQAQNQSFAHLAALRGESMSLTDGTEPERVNALRTSVNILSLLGVKPILGRNFFPEEEELDKANVALIGYGLWQRRYGGNPQLVGQKITLDGKAFTVIGILPAWLKQPGLMMPSLSPSGADVWIPIVPLPNEQVRTFANMRVVACLKAGTSLEQARLEMNAVAARLEQQFPNDNANLALELTPLHEHVVGRVQQGLWILTGAVGFVLLIACANVANLLLARAAGRQNEIAIRTALGATRGALIRQLLTECLVLSLIGGGGGLLLAYLGVPVLTKMSGIPRVDEINISTPVLLFALLISLATGLVFGLLPAWQSSRNEISGTLKEGRKGGGGVTHRRWLRVLVVSEIALSLVLLIGAGLLLRSFRTVSQSNPGFRAENVLTIGVPLPLTSYKDQSQQVQFFERSLAAIDALPGVQVSAMMFRLPLIGLATAIYTTQGHPVPIGQEPNADYRTISPAYFRTMGIPLVKGREFSEHDNATSADAIIINEELAQRAWPGENPIGKRLQIGPERTRFREVVGVVGNAKLTTLEGKADPAIYVPFTQNTWPNALRGGFIVVKTNGDPTAITASIRAALRTIDPSLPISQVRTMESIVSDSLAPRRFNMTLLMLFALVAGVLAAIGIYGVMSYSVTQRTHELGIRLALGAQHSDVIRMVVNDGAKLALIGVGIGLIAAFALTRLMAGLLAGISATDPIVFACVALSLALVALFASYMPARRAARVDPMIALRAD